MKKDVEGQDGEKTEVSWHQSPMAVLKESVKVTQKGHYEDKPPPHAIDLNYYFVCK